MNVIVDTSVWSLALRRPMRHGGPHLALFESAALERRIALLGLVRQEVLSGIRHARQFERIRDDLREFEDVPLEIEDHEVAAHFFNQCRAKGIQGSVVDLLICAVSYRHKFPILTTDRDFDHFARLLPIRLLIPNV